jgi:hypothetical protein
VGPRERVVAPLLTVPQFCLCEMRLLSRVECCAPLHSFGALLVTRAEQRQGKKFSPDTTRHNSRVCVGSSFVVCGSPWGLFGFVLGFHLDRQLEPYWVA